jgi:hypothetical protein
MKILIVFTFPSVFIFAFLYKSEVPSQVFSFLKVSKVFSNQRENVALYIGWVQVQFVFYQGP